MGKGAMVRGALDICDKCHLSAFIHEGETDYVPNASPDADLRAQFPFVNRFTCAACVKARAN